MDEAIETYDEINLRKKNTKMKILITGSEGFIGTHLKKRLKKHQIISYDNLTHPCQYRTGKLNINDDINNILNHTQYFKKQKITHIIHLAAQINVEKSLQQPHETINTNMIGTLKTLQLATILNIPIIHASTTEIYGDKKTQKISENHVMIPKSPYAAAKMGADGLCNAFYHSYNTKVTIIRNFNTFGKYQSNDKWGAVISKFVDRVANNKPPIIYGDGKQKRDFMGYKDAIDFYILCLKNQFYGQEFNVGMGKNISINELAKQIIKLFGKKNMKPIHIKPRRGEVKEFLCDNRKALSVGWKPNTNFYGLLKEYVTWKLKNER